LSKKKNGKISNSEIKPHIFRSSVPRIRESVQQFHPRSARSFHTEPSEHQNLYATFIKYNLVLSKFIFLISLHSSNNCSIGTMNDPSRQSSYSKVPQLPSNCFPDDRTSFGQINPIQIANHQIPIQRNGAEDVLSCCSQETSCPASARNSAKGIDGANRPIDAVAGKAAVGGADSLRRKIKSMECLGNLVS
jgi:hypothetical protein